MVYGHERGHTQWAAQILTMDNGHKNVKSNNYFVMDNVPNARFKAIHRISAPCFNCIRIDLVAYLLFDTLIS